MIATTRKSDNWVLEIIVDSKNELLSSFVALSISHVLQIFIALFAMVIYNKIIPNNASDTLITVTLGICIVVFSDFIFKIIKGRILEVQSRRLDLMLSDRLYGKIIGWDLQSVPKLPGSSALLLRDIDTVVQLVGSSSIGVIVGMPFVILYISIIYLVAQDLALITFLSAVISLIINLTFFKFVERASSKAKDAQVEKSAAFIETLNNIEGVKSLASYTHFFDKWAHVQKCNADRTSELNRFLSDATSATGLVGSLSQVLILAFGAYLIFSGFITSGALIAAVMLHSRAQQPLQAMMQFLMRYSVAKTAVKRLGHVLTTQSNEEKRRENIKVNKLSSAITFRNVKFNVGEVQRSVLTVPAISFSEEQKVGILGSVGSGKSTFVKLLAGVLTPTEGSVAFGAYDTSAIDQAVLRGSVAYLGQQPAIFSGTIRENITLSKREATDVEIEKALELSGFENILRGFPNGLSFVLSEGGRELSGGQKQILALARTLLSEPEVIALDEPTSAMDPRHELLFIRRMKDFTKGRSFFVVTHRRPILALVDRVIVIENGKIVMDGERDEVLSKFS